MNYKNWADSTPIGNNVTNLSPPFRIYQHDPTPQFSACKRVQLIKPTNLSQMTFHLGPRLYTRPPNAFCQPLSEEFLFLFVRGEAADEKEGPEDGYGRSSGADADGTVGFALLDELHELRS